MGKTKKATISIKTLIIACICLIGITITLFTEKSQLRVAAQETTQSGQKQATYQAAYETNERYFCDKGELWHEHVLDASQSKGKVRDCQPGGGTCYAVNNRVTREYSATCIGTNDQTETSSSDLLR